MRANAFLVASSSAVNETVSLMTTSETVNIGMIGTSLNTAAQPGDRLNTLVLNVPKGKAGLVAVSILRFGKNAFSVQFFLSVAWKDGKPWIDLEDAWIPNGDRLGQLSCISAEGLVRVQIGDTTYTSNDTNYEKVTQYVSDTNLLCRYLFGEADAAEVEKAAVTLSKEAPLHQQLKDANDALDTANREKSSWKTAATSLRTAVLDTLVFERRAIEFAISNFPAE